MYARENKRGSRRTKLNLYINFEYEHRIIVCVCKHGAQKGGELGELGGTYHVKCEILCGEETAG